MMMMNLKKDTNPDFITWTRHQQIKLKYSAVTLKYSSYDDWCDMDFITYLFLSLFYLKFITMDRISLCPIYMACSEFLFFLMSCISWLIYSMPTSVSLKHTVFWGHSWWWLRLLFTPDKLSCKLLRWDPRPSFFRQLYVACWSLNDCCDHSN